MRLMLSVSVASIVCALFIPGSAQAANLGIDQLLSTHSQPGAPAISVSVVKGGTFVYRKTIGLADIENGVAAKSNSVFEVGSVSKMFTALAVERLIAAGKLS